MLKRRSRPTAGRWRSTPRTSPPTTASAWPMPSWPRRRRSARDDNQPRPTRSEGHRARRRSIAEIDRDDPEMPRRPHRDRPRRGRPELVVHRRGSLKAPRPEFGSRLEPLLRGRRDRLGPAFGDRARPRRLRPRWRGRSPSTHKALARACQARRDRRGPRRAASPARTTRRPTRTPSRS